MPSRDLHESEQTNCSRVVLGAKFTQKDIHRRKNLARTHLMEVVFAYQYAYNTCLSSVFVWHVTVTPFNRSALLTHSGERSRCCLNIKKAFRYKENAPKQTNKNTHCPSTRSARQAWSRRHSGRPSPMAREHASADLQTPSAERRDANLAVAHRPLACTKGLLTS